MKILKNLFLLCIFNLAAQSPYPQDYFRSPLDIQLVLSGTFAELRSNHFHSGLDIKTNGKEGLEVYSIAEGYVSRIKISRYGYGKALYITHPNGYTSVYAHLQKFSPTIEQYIKRQQYLKEQFEIELFPKPSTLVIDADEMIAYSGNSGGSSGPHLHFEIHDKHERPINPMLFGFDIKDTTAPELYQLYAYPISNRSHVEGNQEKKKIRLRKQANGNYIAEPIKAFGTIGFGIVANDRQDYAANKNGVYKIEAFFNGKKATNSIFEVRSNQIIASVYGTKFNFKNFSEDFSSDIVLVEGSLGISNENSNDINMLSPGYKASIDKEVFNISKSKVNSKIYTSWVDGDVIFRNETFDQIIQKLQRLYNITIINNSKISNQLFNASINVEEEKIEEVLGYFNKIYNIDFQIFNNKIIIN
jgi:hypothetical protein